VTSDCKDFRAALEAELLGRPAQEKLAGLSWHAHLLACGECRELLEKEEALEALLASLPEPRLPEALARRVLSRLRADRAAETRLEELLELDEGARAPLDLAAGILARLAPEREAQAARLDDMPLETLLDLDSYLEAPHGLARRVLAALEIARTPRRARRTWIYAAAAGLMALFLGRMLWIQRHPTRDGRGEIAAGSEPAPDPQMLAALDVLEQWDLLMQDDVDVLLSTLGPADEALLDYR